MNKLEQLIEIFRRFPGIGPRQAKRFAYYLMTRDDQHNKNLASLIADVKKEIKKCSLCLTVSFRVGFVVWSAAAAAWLLATLACPAFSCYRSQTGRLMFSNDYMSTGTW